ncbi:hypothetical protein GGR57DRAFT_219443 [Xylariaceae sp. FL1272]|nr:hypothetical protein GGR57DRAFT_219443 [Xylariaceae sp. FL1272]
MCYYSRLCSTCGRIANTPVSRCCPLNVVCNVRYEAAPVPCDICRAHKPWLAAAYSRQQQQALVLVPNPVVGAVPGPIYELPATPFQRCELPANPAQSTAQQPYNYNQGYGNAQQQSPPFQHPQVRSMESWLNDQNQNEASSRTSDNERPSTCSRGTQTDSRRNSQYGGQLRRNQSRSRTSSRRDYEEDFDEEVQNVGGQVRSMRSGPDMGMNAATDMMAAMSMNMPGGGRVAGMMMVPQPSRSSRSGGHRRSSSRRYPSRPASPSYEVEEEDDYKDHRRR